MGVVTSGAGYEAAMPPVPVALDTDLVVHRDGEPQGPPLLLLHGLTDSGQGWRDAIGRWRDRFAVVAPDQRGHGESPRFSGEQRAAHPGDVMVEDAARLLEQLDGAVVVGHSLGGAVALAAAVRRPDLVRALVLEDPAPLGPEEPQHDPARGEELLAGLRPSIEAPDEQALLALRREQHPDWPEADLLPTGLAEQQVDRGYLAHGDLKPSARWPELFAEVTVPTLVVSGDRPAEICVTDTMERGLAEIGNPRVRLVRVPSSGHCIRREQPEAFHAVVAQWWAELGIGTA